MDPAQVPRGHPDKTLESPAERGFGLVPEPRRRLPDRESNVAQPHPGQVHSPPSEMARRREVLRELGEREFDDAIVVATVKQVTGQAPRTFEQWARAHLGDFQMTAIGE
jgi:hypothetical protein